MYVKSTWDPDMANEETEDMLQSFEHDIRSERKMNRSRPRATNLSKHQFNILKHLRHNKSIIILCCNKNLGPAVMQREVYIQEALR